MIRAIAAIGLVFILSNVEAQRIQNLSVGIGGVHQSSKDFGMSPLLYNNFGGGFFSYFESYRGPFLKRLSLDLSYAFITNNYTNVGEMHSGKVDFYYDWLVRILPEAKTSLYLGPSFGFTGAFRYHSFFINSAFNYDFAQPLSLACQLNREITILGRGLSLQYRLQIPLVAAVIRPAFASPFPHGLERFDVELQEAFFRSNRVYFLTTYTRFINNLSLLYPVGQRHHLRLGYAWDFYRILSPNHLYFAEHSLQLSFVFGLRRD
jgi:FAD/FMN-containing dehydrogenase